LSGAYVWISVPVAALSSPEISESAKEVDFSKVWAECFHEIELRVGALPEHEITQALLP
jgi:hypothetical protein